MEYVITDSIGELLVDFIYSNIKLILNTLSEKINKQSLLEWSEHPYMLNLNPFEVISLMFKTCLGDYAYKISTIM